jgi:quercetin dioxygenase-like cupin family protein
VRERGADRAFVPDQEGLFVIRAKLPANYRIPPHSHPTDEVVTVLSGTLFVGMGDKLAPDNVKAFSGGSLVVAPAKTNHYVLTKQPTGIEVTAMGPLRFDDVNPADDPSKTWRPAVSRGRRTASSSP